MGEKTKNGYWRDFDDFSVCVHVSDFDDFSMYVYLYYILFIVLQ